jgi:hypothetical protein
VGSSYTEDFTVYIDYNHNGTFTDAGEMVAEVRGSAAVSKAFTVPTTALNGTTRMRIQMQYGSYETNPCATYTYGEVQDYTVNITGNAQRPVWNQGGDESAIATENISAVNLYPNPAQDNMTLQFVSNNNNAVRTNVYNLSGQRVMNAENTAIQGLNTFNINTSQLTNGVYIFEIENNGELKHEKFIIQK